MKIRIITALICIPLLVTLLCSPTYIVCAAVMLVSLIGMSEFCKAVGLSEKKPLYAVSCTAAVIIPLCMYFKPWLVSHTNARFDSFLLYAAVVTLFCIMLVCHKKIGIKDVALTAFGMVYIPYFLSHIILVRALENGRFLIWLIFIGAFLTDTGAYFIGVFFGKHKLCPEISPKKTVEGAFGGILGGVFFCLLYGLLLKYIFSLSVNFILLAVMGVIVSIISELGDLAASIIKRQYGIKDYGTLFPGHGGILDRCDSVIFVAPAVYLLVGSIFSVIA